MLHRKQQGPHVINSQNLKWALLIIIFIHTGWSTFGPFIRDDDLVASNNTSTGNSEGQLGTSSTGRTEVNSISNLPALLRSNGQMQAYLKLHRSSLQTTSDKSLRVKKGTPLLVWSNRDNVNGGIGDRVKGMLGAFLFAICTNRIFLVEYVHPTNLDQVLVAAGLIHWDASFSEDDVDDGFLNLIDQAHEVNQDPGLLSLDSKYNSLGMRVSTNSWGNFTSSSSLLEDLLAPYGNTFSLEAQHDLFYTLFQFTPAAKLRAESMLSLPNAGEDYIAAHVRTGDSSFINEFWKGSGRKHVGRHPRHAGGDVPQQFFSCAQKLQTGMKDLGRPHRPMIYIASDEEATKTRIRDLDPQSIVLAKNMTLLHVGREDQKGYESKKVAGHLDAWAEILILANSACIVGSRSGYSDLAVALSNRQRPLARCGLKFWECNETGIKNALANLANDNS
ncbi:MAG: hypothetical protein SGBAC_010070 [Bacillariaceae sp.]